MTRRQRYVPMNQKGRLAKAVDVTAKAVEVRDNLKALLGPEYEKHLAIAARVVRLCMEKRQISIANATLHLAQEAERDPSLGTATAKSLAVSAYFAAMVEMTAHGYEPPALESEPNVKA